MSLRQYSEIFGRPGEGAHRTRIGGLAAVDLLATGGLAFLIGRLAFPRKATGVPPLAGPSGFALGVTDLESLALVFLILIIAAIPIHKAFGVNTRLNAWLYGQPWPAAHVVT